MGMRKPAVLVCWELGIERRKGGTCCQPVKEEGHAGIEERLDRKAGVCWTPARGKEGAVGACWTPKVGKADDKYAGAC